VLFGRGDTPQEKVLATNASQPTFSPDGRFIAFIRDGDLYLIHADGSHQKRIARGPGILSHPAWWMPGER
jgi:Tol biopolymer transport system component